LPWGKYQYAREIVVVPAHLLFREEADDLMGRGGLHGTGFPGVSEDEEVVEESRDVIKDGFVVEKELCKEGEVLTVELLGVRFSQ
jgi:hypothetical protein